jgi:hypothetical protein
MNLMRVGNFAFLALDLHLLVAALFFLNPPMKQFATVGLCALIIFTGAVIAITPRR